MSATSDCSRTYDVIQQPGFKKIAFRDCTAARGCGVARRRSFSECKGLEGAPDGEIAPRRQSAVDRSTAPEFSSAGAFRI
jgi:hypothetical protein